MKKDEFHYRTCSVNEEISFPCDCDAEKDHEAELRAAQDVIEQLYEACGLMGNTIVGLEGVLMPPEIETRLIVALDTGKAAIDKARVFLKI